MNSQQLSCFVCVAEKLSFTKASEQLYLSVPTVTHHIKMLEYELNTTLFIRDKHKVSLTEDGKSFYDEAKNILRIENDFKQRLSNKEETLKIICTSYSELSLISLVIRQLDNIRPEIFVKKYSEGLYMINHDETDVMLGSENMLLEDKELILDSCKNMSAYLVLNKDDPLSLKNNIYFKDLENKTIIRIDDQLIPFFSKNRIKDLLNIHKGRSNDFICQDELVCLSLIEAGYGLSVFPEYRLPKYLSSQFVIKSIEENEPYKYGLIIKKGNKSNALKLFREKFNTIIKNYRFNDDIQ